MAKSNDKKKKGTSGLVRYMIILALLVLVFLFFKKDNLITWIQSAFALRSQKNEIERLEKENAALDTRIDALSNNKDSLEQFARETYHFSEKGEDVYLLE